MAEILDHDRCDVPLQPAVERLHLHRITEHTQPLTNGVPAPSPHLFLHARSVSRKKATDDPRPIVTLNEIFGLAAPFEEQKRLAE